MASDDSAAITYVLAAQASADFAMPSSFPDKDLDVRSQAKARRDALNSTGSVITANRSTAQNKVMPIQNVNENDANQDDKL